MRYLGMNDLQEIKRMTIAEYSLRMKAYRLRELDCEYHIALQAWMNREIQATKRKSKTKYESVYKDFSKFFDYEGKQDVILKGEKELKKKPATGMAGRYAEYMRMRHGDD